MENNKNDMNPNVQVTNWMLYELIRDFKDDVNRRFSEMDKKMEELKEEIMENRRQIKENRRQIEENRRQIEENRSKIEENSRNIQLLYDSRGQVTVKFTRAWAGASLSMALLASTIVLAIDRAF